MRKESLANTLLKHNFKNFLDEIRSMNRHDMMLFIAVDNAYGKEEITQIWKNYYIDLFNSRKKQCHININRNDVPYSDDNSH